MAQLNPAKYYNYRLMYTCPSVPRFSSEAARSMLNLAVRDEKGTIAVYDPFLGNGTIFSVAQVNFYEIIGHLFGLDVNEKAIATAKKNMKLLTNPKSLDNRIKDLKEKYLLDSTLHRRTEVLKTHLQNRESIGYDIQEGNALTFNYPESDHKRVIVTDPPYGKSSLWINEDNENTNESQLEAFLLHILEEKFSKAILAFDNKQNLRRLLKKYFTIKDSKQTKGRVIYLLYVEKKRKSNK